MTRVTSASPAPEMTAQQVSEYLLDKTGRALLTGDVDLFQSCMAFPNIMQTFDGQICCETPAHFRVIFGGVMRHFRSSGVTDMIRHCVAARYLDPVTVEATHESRVLSGNTVVQPAYPVFSLLKWIEGDWRITSSVYAITDAPAHSRALVAEPLPETLQSRA